MWFHYDEKIGYGSTYSKRAFGNSAYKKQNWEWTEMRVYPVWFYYYEKIRNGATYSNRPCKLVHKSI